VFICGLTEMKNEPNLLYLAQAKSLALIIRANAVLAVVPSAFILDAVRRVMRVHLRLQK